MRFKKIAFLVLPPIITLLFGVFIGRITKPLEVNVIENQVETVVEKEVEKIVEVEKLVEIESKTSGLAKIYLLKAIDILDIISRQPTYEDYYQTTLGMRELASEQYTLWDNLLNEIYKKLQSVLPEEEMKQLTEKQIQWIDYRDTTAENEGKKYEGGTMQPLMITLSKSYSTKDRCLELINLYM